METKEAVNYREGDEMQSCQLCIHFKPDGTCALVEGKILPEGVCNLFEAAEGGEESIDAFLFGA